MFIHSLYSPLGVLKKLNSYFSGSAVCYLWCTEDGDLPSHANKGMDSGDSFLAEINDFARDEIVTLFDPDEILRVSPLSVYSLSLSNDNMPTISLRVGDEDEEEKEGEGNSKITSMYYKFDYVAADNLVASVLLSGVGDSNVCGDFGLVFIIRGQDGNVKSKQELCLNGQVSEL